MLDEDLRAELEQFIRRSSMLVHIAKDAYTQAKIGYLDKVG